MRKGLSFSEAGRLGAEASKEWHIQEKVRRVEEYEKNPTRCCYCNKKLGYEKRDYKFCNRSCAASFNNTGKRRRGIDKECLCCFGVVKKGASKFCSLKCQQQHKYQEYIKKWFIGQEEGGSPWRVSYYVKRWLRENNGIKCSVCGVNEWMGKEIPLIMDHIDGDHRNNKIGNLRLVCGNCDMQLPTYKNKNKGNGRAYRRQRYKDGKSY